MGRFRADSQATVAGIVGHAMAVAPDQDAFDQRWFIFMETVAGGTILTSLVWLYPNVWKYVIWPIDIVLFILWITVLGVLLHYIQRFDCGPSLDFTNITAGSQCDMWKAAIAFSVLSVFFWVTSALLVSALGEFPCRY
jgi:hypothetical protein